ncbi:MAG: hypothetical protein IBX63_11050 [Coriobacteriia bacterium]|nr:hypothetical protein [Coriobacteriia bacterium]
MSGRMVGDTRLGGRERTYVGAIIVGALSLTALETILPWRGGQSVRAFLIALPLVLVGVLFAVRDSGHWTSSRGVAIGGHALLPTVYILYWVLPGTELGITWVLLWGIAAGRALQALAVEHRKRLA